MNEIFRKKYLMWWFINSIVIGLKIIIFGLKPGGIGEMPGYEKYGLIFWIIGVQFSSIIFSLPLYGIYYLFKRKNNNKLLMILISTISFLTILFLL